MWYCSTGGLRVFAIGSFLIVQQLSVFSSLKNCNVWNEARSIPWSYLLKQADLLGQLWGELLLTLRTAREGQPHVRVFQLQGLVQVGESVLWGCITRKLFNEEPRLNACIWSLLSEKYAGTTYLQWSHCGRSLRIDPRGNAVTEVLHWFLNIRKQQEVFVVITATLW